MKWRPIKDAPHNVTVDLWCVHPERGACRSANMRQIGGEWRGLFYDALNPGWIATHWMPLPEPPATDATLTEGGTES